MTSAGRPFPTNIYVWLTYDDPLDADRLVQRLFISGVAYIDSANIHESNFLQENPSMLVMVDEDWPDEYVALYGSYNAVLPSQLRTAETASGTPIDSYMIYSTSGVSTYIWRIPSG